MTNYNRQGTIGVLQNGTWRVSIFNELRQDIKKSNAFNSAQSEIIYNMLDKIEDAFLSTIK